MNGTNLVDEQLNVSLACHTISDISTQLEETHRPRYISFLETFQRKMYKTLPVPIDQRAKVIDAFVPNFPWARHWID